MNLLATASDLQIKGLSQIQETRTTQLTSEATPPLPEVKPAAKQQAPVEVNKVKPAAELRVKPVAPAPPPSSSSIGQEGRVSEDCADLQYQQQHAGNSLKRKHDQSGSEHHSRISFRSNSSGWSGGGGSRHQQQLQQDCEETQVAAALRDLKTEVGDLGSSSSSSGSTGALAPLHSEDTRVTTQVLSYRQSG
jgi:hypothetical protein